MAEDYWTDGSPYRPGPYVPITQEQQELLDKTQKEYAAWRKTVPSTLGGFGGFLKLIAPLLAAGVGWAVIPGLIAGVGASGAAGAAGAAGAGAGAGAAGAGAAGAGALGAGAGALGAAGTVSELVITAAASGMSIPAIAAATGLGAATVGSILSSGGGTNTLAGGTANDALAVNPPTTMDPIVVNGATGSAVDPLLTATGAGLGAVPLTTGSPLAVNPTGATTMDDIVVHGNPGSEFLDPALLPATVFGGTGLAALTGGGGVGTEADIAALEAAGTNTATDLAALPELSGGGVLGAVQDKGAELLAWAKANPLQAAALGLSVAGGIGGAATSATTGVGANGAAGTRASLDPRFSVTSPHWQLAAQTPANMSGTDWANYGHGPEKRFFVNPNASTGPSETNYPPAGQGFSHGGFAVTGEGDGREDAIDAKLSDGEYVVDAETVAMLGNGSNKAGADKLDAFRVNVRKHKGQALAKGRFSVKAKAPEAYMAGGND